MMIGNKLNRVLCSSCVTQVLDGKVMFLLGRTSVAQRSTCLICEEPIGSSDKPKERITAQEWYSNTILPQLKAVFKSVMEEKYAKRKQ